MPDESMSAPLSVAILGTDAVLAAAPATPVQLAHACLAAGYGAVVPASWGDELLATECLRRTTMLGRNPVVCALCPRVTDRLLASGGELSRFAVALVSPPVATARYLRAMCGDDRVRITYIGACPGADDESIDDRITPDDFLDELTGRGIAMLEQPQVFDSIIPPDRRRFQSLPGGVPSPEALWAADGRTLIEIDDEDYVTDLAQRLINREHSLLDIAPKLGCVCSGAIEDVAPRSARIAVAAIEPPRSATPVIDASVPVDLVRSLPSAAPARQVVLPAALELLPPVHAAPPAPVVVERPQRPAAAPVVPRRRSTTPEGMAAIDPPAPQKRTAGPAVAARPIVGAVPTVASAEGRALPRAYVARRRTGRTPPDNQAISPDGSASRPAERERPIEAVVEPARTPVPVAASAKPAERTPVSTLAHVARGGLERLMREPMRLAMLIGILIVASMLVGIFAGRRLAGTPPEAVPSAEVIEDDGAQEVGSPTDENTANRVTERGGAVGPELRAPSASQSSRRGVRRTVPDAPARRPRAAAVVTPSPPRPAGAAADTARQPEAASVPVSVPVPVPVPVQPAPTVTRQDSIDRELQAIARELELRRARLDSIERRGTRPPR